jgi:regulatory protein
MDNFDKLYNKTLHFLSFRPRSEKEIRDYLKNNSSYAKASEGQEKKTKEDLINSIINKLKEHKFLNDEEFVLWWFEQRTKVNPKSTRIIKVELQRKGIDKDLIETIIFQNKNLDLENAIKIANKKYERIKNEDKKKIYEKLFRFLGSKGFDYDTIKEVIDRIFSKEYNNK